MLRVDGQSARTCGLLLPTKASVIENAQYRLSALFVPAEFVPPFAATGWRLGLGPGALCGDRSEQELRRQLNDAWVPGRRDHAERRTPKRPTGIGERRCVQEIERFDAELQRRPRSKRQTAGNCQVHVPVTRPANGIA